MVRKNLVTLRPKTDPEYSTLVNQFKEASQLKRHLSVIATPALRFFVAAFKKDFNSMPQVLYEAIRRNPTKFEKLLDNYLDSHAKALALDRYKCWIGYNDGVVKTVKQVADRFYTYPASANRSIEYIVKLITSERFIRYATDGMMVDVAAKNTISYEKVKDKLDKYSGNPERQILKNEEHEKVRIMLILFRRFPEQFSREEYERLKKGNNAFTAVDIQIRNLLPENYANVVEAYIGIGQPPDLRKKSHLNSA